MQHFRKELGKRFVASLHQIKPGIVENPLVRPIAINEPVLPDIALHGVVATIGRRQVSKVENALQESDFVMPSMPSDIFDTELVADVPPRFFRNQHKCFYSYGLIFPLTTWDISEVLYSWSNSIDCSIFAFIESM
jgi:hypothetical protein